MTYVGGSAGVDGDYNGNGVVDAADYTVWRDSLGQTGPISTPMVTAAVPSIRTTTRTGKTASATRAAAAVLR